MTKLIAFLHCCDPGYSRAIKVNLHKPVVYAKYILIEIGIGNLEKKTWEKIFMFVLYSYKIHFFTAIFCGAGKLITIVFARIQTELRDNAAD